MPFKLVWGCLCERCEGLLDHVVKCICGENVRWKPSWRELPFTATLYGLPVTSGPCTGGISCCMSAPFSFPIILFGDQKPPVSLQGCASSVCLNPRLEAQQDIRHVMLQFRIFDLSWINNSGSTKFCCFVMVCQHCSGYKCSSVSVGRCSGWGSYSDYWIGFLVACCEFVKLC